MSIAITIGFTQTQYSVEEDTGIFQPGPVAIVKEASRVSEQVLTINMDFIDITATSGTINFVLYIPLLHCINVIHPSCP